MTIHGPTYFGFSGFSLLCGLQRYLVSEWSEGQGSALTASMTRIKMNFNEKKARANNGRDRANKGKEK